MAVYYVQHHLYPDNPQVFLSDITQITTVSSQGDAEWHIAIYTSGIDSNGDSLGPYYINSFSGIADVDTLISNKIEEICLDIDWSVSWYGGEYEEGIDNLPPKILWQYPEPSQTSVPINSSVSARIVDLLPSTGIDLSSISMAINGITITPLVYGNKYDAVISFRPRVAE
jgi:hypothetical protein